MLFKVKFVFTATQHMYRQFIQYNGLDPKKYRPIRTYRDILGMRGDEVMIICCLQWDWHPDAKEIVKYCEAHGILRVTISRSLKFPHTWS